ncbi:hypothetical protein JCM3770_006227 [Rhodotorula araucariae]
MSRAVGVREAADQVAACSAPVTRRWTRPNVWLGKVIPLALLVFAIRGYALVLLEIIPLLWSRRPSVALCHAVVVHFALAMTAYSYFTVYFLSLGPPPEKEPPKAVAERRVIYACDTSGDPLRCHLDRCGGAYQSLRSRHCRDCGTCRPIFDHHCGFMDNCVCGPTLKPFATFLGYAAALLLVALVPLVPLQWRACREVVRETWWSDEMRNGWWSGWRGWLGGPVYRYTGALLRGYKQYQRTAHDRPLLISDTSTRTFRRGAITYAYQAPQYPSLAVPRLSTLFVTFFAAFISVIALVMLYIVTRNIRRGFTSVQLERIKRHRASLASAASASPGCDARQRVFVPLSGVERGGGAIILLDPDLPLFDLGAGTNWRRVMGGRWWEWALPWVPRCVSLLWRCEFPKVDQQLTWA